jgi:hypothetical protein
MASETPHISSDLHQALGRFAAADAGRIHRVQVDLARLVLHHAPPHAPQQLELGLGFLAGNVPSSALHEARQDCWTYVGSLACGCSISDSASAHAIMTCLETDDAAHSPSGLAEQVERALRCGAAETDVLAVLQRVQLD